MLRVRAIYLTVFPIGNFDVTVSFVPGIGKCKLVFINSVDKVLWPHLRFVTSVGPSSQRIKEFWYFPYFRQGIASFFRFFFFFRGISLWVNPNTPLFDFPTSVMTIVLSEFTLFFKEKPNLASSFPAFGTHCMFFAFLFACFFV